MNTNVRTRQMTRKFYHSATYSVRGMDVDVDVYLTYLINPPDPKSGVFEASAEVVEAVDDDTGEPIPEWLFDKMSENFREAADAHLMEGEL